MPEYDQKNPYGGGSSANYGSAASKAGMQSKQGFGGSNASSKAGMQSKQSPHSSSKAGMQSKQGNVHNWSSNYTPVNPKFDVDASVSVSDRATGKFSWDKRGTSTENTANSNTDSNHIVNSDATVQLGTVKVKNGIYNTENEDNLKKIEVIRQLRFLNPTWTDVDVANFIEGDDWSMRKFKRGDLEVNPNSWGELDKLPDRLTYGLGLRGDTNIGVALSRDDYTKMHRLLGGDFQVGSDTWNRQQLLVDTMQKFSKKSSLSTLFKDIPSLTNLAIRGIEGVKNFLKNEPMAGHEEGINDIGWNNLALRQIRRSEEDGILEMMPDGSNPINAVLALGSQEEIAKANKLKSLLGDKYETRAFQAQRKKYQEGIDKKYAELYDDTIEEDMLIDQGHEPSYREEWKHLADSLKTGIGSDDISSLYYDGDSFNVNKEFKINSADRIMNEGIDNKAYNINNATTNESIDEDEEEETITTPVTWGGPRDRHSFEWMMTGTRPDGAVDITEPSDVKTELNTYNTTQTHKYYYNQFTGKYEHYNVNTGTTEELDEFQMRDLLNLSYVTTQTAKQGGIVGFMEKR